jgi:hypothetical protein
MKELQIIDSRTSRTADEPLYIDIQGFIAQLSEIYGQLLLV